MNFIAKYVHVIGLLGLGAFAVAAACLYFDVPAPFQKPNSAETVKPAYTCPMHPDVMQDRAGNCPKCGMALVAARTASMSHADCQHEGAPDGCCTKPAATEKRLPPGHPPVKMQLPLGHPPIEALRTNLISATARKPAS